MNVAQELADDKLYDYDTLVKLLSAWFDPASRVYVSRSRFHGQMRRHHEDADAYADALTELCRVGYPQSPPELRQELISEQFVRGQSDPELKKYLWVIIRTQKDRKLQTLIEVCTDFARIGQPTTVHRPVEQVFAMEEEEDPEDMVAMVEQPQWTGRGTTEPQMSPSLQQMFALARSMGYEMRPIARRSENNRQMSNPQRTPVRTTGRRLDRDVIIPRSSASAADRWNTRKLGAPNRISRSPSDRTGGIPSPMAHDIALTDHNREMAYRLGTHPYPRSSPSFTSTNSSQSFHPPTGSSLQFVVQDVTASTDASFVHTIDGASVYHGSVAHDSDQPSTGLQTDRPDITYDSLQIDHADSQRDQPDLTHMEQEDDLVMQISGTGHWFLEGWIGDHSVEFMMDSGSSVTAMSNFFYRTLIQAGAPLGIL